MLVDRSWKAREYDFSTRFIELAGEVNKKDVDDLRESPALKILQLLHERGAGAAPAWAATLLRFGSPGSLSLRSVPAQPPESNTFNVLLIFPFFFLALLIKLGY
jgi:hypothetical protein